jgi:hypothetical protein
MSIAQAGGLFAVGLVVFLSCAVTYQRVGVQLFDRMGTGDFKFNESWSSTLTVLGGMLTTIVAAQILPSNTPEQKITKGTLVAFHLMFSAVIVVAAGLYNTFRFQKENVTQPPGGTPKVGERPPRLSHRQRTPP